MKFINRIVILLVSVVLVLPECVFARGRGGGGFGGGGGRIGGGGGGGAHFGGGGGGLGGGGARPNFGGGGGGGGHANFGGGGFGGGGGASRPNFGGGGANHSPSFSHPIGGGSSRPNIGGGGFAGGHGGFSGGGFGGGNRPEIGGGNRPNFGGGGNRPEIGGGNRPNISGETFHGGNFNGGNRPNIGGGGNRTNIGNGGIRDNTNIGNRTNIGHIGNNNFNNFNNVHNNINIASNRPYYNNWQHGNWNGNWNRPGGSGYWNGYAHGYQRGYWNGGWGGYWHGEWGGYGYWGRPWYSNPIAWGLGAWAVGSIIYNSGYASYSNPYYSGGDSSSTYYDYSQPIVVNNQQPMGYDTTQVANVDPTNPGNSASSTPVPPEVQAGTSHVDAAREAFKNGDYATAMREVDLAIQSLPKDAALHEFRALVFFATKDYKQAAATLYAVLSAGPGWDWTTLSGMYASSETYTNQLRELEQYVKANPSSAEAHFVLAYHYLTCGHNDAAVKQYQDVAKLQPGDQLTAQLLKMLDADAPATATADQTLPPSATPETDPVAPAAIDAAKIVGNWTAKKPNGPTFTLNLTNDAKFTWGYEQGAKKETFGGKYSVDGAILVLERTDGAQMPGLITLASNGFNFKLYGGPPDDTGLDFTK